MESEGSNLSILSYIDSSDIGEREASLMRSDLKDDLKNNKSLRSKIDE